MPARLTEIRSILETIVGFDTTSSKSNMPMIDWIRDYLDALGIESRLASGADETKANLYATIAGDGANGIEGGVALSGHTDVVPVTGQTWATDPFVLTERDDKLFGRGTADMKGFIAIALAMAPALKAAKLKTPVHFAFSFDEEVGCKGVPHLIERLGRDLPKPSLVLVGEPTSMRVVDGHKGIAAMRTTVTGLEAHSSRPHEAVSAVVYATRTIRKIEEIVDGLRIAGRTDEGFMPAWTTFNIGQIEGGSAVNIVPNRCRFDWEFRPIPGVAAEEVLDPLNDYVRAELLPQMQAVSPGAGIENRDDGPVASDAGRRPVPGGCTGAQADRRQPHGEGLLRHRGGPVRAGGYPRRHLRPRRYRPGPQAGRIHRNRPARGRRPLCPAAGRMGGGRRRYRGAGLIGAFAGRRFRYFRAMSGADDPATLPDDGIAAADIGAFIARWEKSGGAELANFQTFANELCDLLDLPRPDPSQERNELNDHVFERRVDFKHDDGSATPGRIDLYKRGCFVMEAKQSAKRVKARKADPRQPGLLPEDAAQVKAGTATRGTRGWDSAMRAAKRQAEDYARALPKEHGWPPFVLVVDVGYVIEVYADFSGQGKNYAQFPDRSGYSIPLAGLRDPEICAGCVRSGPSRSPRPARRSAEVTRDIAERLALIAGNLEGKHDAKEVAEFLMRCLFTMFAEDVGLLPERGFEKLLEQMVETPQHFAPALESLWQVMDEGGYAAYLNETVKRFNGALFRNRKAIALAKEQIRELRIAASRDWREVEPAIFGTLLERALDERERAKLGAHYTPRVPMSNGWSSRRSSSRCAPTGRRRWPMRMGWRRLATATARSRRSRISTISSARPACSTRPAAPAISSMSRWN